MNLHIAIDGACRRNGKPDCVSAGGALVLHFDGNKVIKSTTLSNYEIGSTNQRGELLALLAALDYVWEAKLPAHIITDSEYIFNTITKEWNKSWAAKGWTTAAGDPVKNKDIWLEISNAQRRCEDEGIEFVIYHIKGHCIPFGKVTAQTLLNTDSTGHSLLKAALAKYDSSIDKKRQTLDAALELSMKNNGFELTPQVLRRFVVTNVVADAVATRCVEAADMLL